MFLKRQYDIPDGWEPQRDANGTLLNPLPTWSFSLLHTGTHTEQNFSRRMVESGVAQGWIMLSKGQLILHTVEEDLTYTIVRGPGMYCCHCQADLGEDPSGGTGRAHVEQQHAGVESPDRNNLSGFRMLHGYECLLDEQQHARWNGQAVQQAREAAATPEERAALESRRAFAAQRKAPLVEHHARMEDGKMIVEVRPVAQRGGISPVVEDAPPKEA